MEAMGTVVKQSRSLRRDDESRASGSGARAPRQRRVPGHPYHGMSPAPLVRRLGTAPRASEVALFTGSQPALNFDAEAWSPNWTGFASSANPLLAIEPLPFPRPPPEALPGPSLMQSQFDKLGGPDTEGSRTGEDECCASSSTTSKFLC